MKRILLYLVISIFAVNVFCSNISADEYEFNYTVTLTSDFKFESDYKNDTTGYGNVEVNKAIQNALNSMEPGDSATINFTLKNNYEKPVDWYMLNDTLKPFEADSRVDKDNKRTVDGGNYTYQLLYKNSHGENVDIYDIKNIRNDNLNYDRLGYSVKNDEILESQYPGYTVKVKNVTKFYRIVYVCRSYSF